MASLLDLKIELKEKRSIFQEKREEAEEALENDDLDKAKLIKEELDKIKEEIKELDERVTKLEQENDDEDEEDEEENQEADGDGEEMNGEVRIIDGANNPRNQRSGEVRAFKQYLETREVPDIPGGSLKTDSGFVVIPEEIKNEILKLKEAEFNLDQYVTVKQVGYGSGKFPVVRQSEVAALPEVEELAENPELAVKPFYMLGYDIKTHRGYFLVSREAIEDASVDVLAELKEWMARTIASTRNSGIIKALKEGTPGKEGETLKLERKQAVGIDGIKDAINLNVKPNYEHNIAIVSQSGFNELDKMKDSNGRYLLQEDVKEPTQKRLLGARVVVLPDEMLGEESGNTIIVGNLKDAIVLFDRSQYQAGWTDYMHFGEALMVAVRQDVRILDEKAAIILDFEPEADDGGTGGDDGDLEG